MDNFILHHYAMSPYSEKIRVMLGYAQLPWQSVITQEMPPRRPLEPLAGGYKRIPVAQIGADVFCDSNLIAEEIARMSGIEALSLSKAPDTVQSFVNLAEGKVFFACVLAGGSATLRKKAMQNMNLWDIGRFVIDRLNMGRKATTKIVSFKQARPVAEGFIQQCEDQLQHAFLFGDQVTIADFAAYHCLWFIRDLGEHDFIHRYVKVIAWMDRLSAFKQAPQKELSAEQALDIAKAAQPRTLALVQGQQQSQYLNRSVSIAPADYRQVPTRGELVGETESSWILRRNSERVGQVHTHFPKEGYSIES